MSRLSGPERGEQNLAKVRDYLAGLQSAGQFLPLEDGRPNISAIAEAAGVLRNVFYTNSGVKRLLAEFVGVSSPVADGAPALLRAQQQAEAKDRVMRQILSPRMSLAISQLSSQISDWTNDGCGIGYLIV